MLFLTKHESPGDLSLCGHFDTPYPEPSPNHCYWIANGQQMKHVTMWQIEKRPTTPNLPECPAFKNMYKNNIASLSGEHTCHKWVGTFITSPKRHGSSEKRQPATMQFGKWLKYSAYDDVRIHFFHIMQHEMNATNTFTTNRGGGAGGGLESRRGQKREAEEGRAVTCGNTASDLMTTHPSKVFALLAELIAVWFSTDTHLHTNVSVTNLSICPLSHGRKQSEHCGNLDG